MVETEALRRGVSNEMLCSAPALNVASKSGEHMQTQGRHDSEVGREVGWAPMSHEGEVDGCTEKGGRRKVGGK